LTDRSGLPNAAKAGNPPYGIPGSSPLTLVRTPVWRGYCPVSSDVRETQQSESTVKAWV
jgi:hypothetical protein